MLLRRAVTGPFIIALAAAAGGTMVPLAQQPPRVPGTFRSSIALVPVDVRVLDRNGKPITDLTQADFTLLEDGVRQDIRHFSSHAITAAEVEPSAARPMRDAGATDLPPQTRRTFLIVLGRGRLEGPSKGLEAALGFVRERLFPQDEVAVLAYNRATDFTTEHELAAQTIERFRDAHHSIEAKLVHGVSGLAGIYGTRSIPVRIQSQIDEIFRGTEGLGFRRVPPGRITDAGRIADDAKRVVDRAISADPGAIVADRERPLQDPSDPTSRGDFSLEEFVLNNTQTMSDLENLYTGIEYLRYLEGEKHLVFITERGLFLPRLEDDTSIAAMANDARVVIDTIQTGGVSGGPIMNGRLPLAPGPSFTETFAVGTLRTMAELTGGHASIYSYADKAVEHIDRSTRFQYLLGYAPAGAMWDGAYRRITVKVNRPDVEVAYRQGYYARRQLVPYDRQEFLTYSRISAAALYPEAIRDIKLKVKTSIKRSDEGLAAVVDLQIDPERLALEVKGTDREGELDVAIFCWDAEGRSVGELWKVVQVTLNADTYPLAVRSGVPYTITVPVRSHPRTIKIVVYDYRGDVVGTAENRIQ
jgi:VWFA-related protein